MEDASDIWTDGETIWVADDGDDKIYAYELPEPSEEDDTASRVTVERITATSAVITTNMRNFPYAFVETTKPLSLHYARGGTTWYIIDGNDSVSMPINDLEPETEYTVRVKFNHNSPVGEVTFTSTHSGLRGMAVSGVTPTEARVTVSELPGSEPQTVLPALQEEQRRQRARALDHVPLPAGHQNGPVTATSSLTQAPQRSP